jgi:hypothetical protein
MPSTPGGDTDMRRIRNIGLGGAGVSSRRFGTESGGGPCLEYGQYDDQGLFVRCRTSGAHKLAVAEKNAEDPKLMDAIVIKEDDLAFNTTFQVSVPCFNRKEGFEILVLFDAEASPVNAHCRMENLRFKIRRSKSASEDALSMLVVAMQRSGLR